MLPNQFVMDERDKELKANIERRFKEYLRRSRECCDYFNYSISYAEGKGGVLLATVSFVWALGEKTGHKTANYEYQSQSPSHPIAGWYCTQDWTD